MTAATIPRSTAEERVKAALWFAARGFRVLSVWSTLDDGTCRCPAGKLCGSAGKHPVTEHGFRDATADPATIRTLLSAGSQPNYGLVPPEGCFALDVDEAPALAALARLTDAHGPLPSTLTTRTAHGTHVILRWPVDVPRPTGNLYGIVTRWGGDPGTGYIIGPKSVHATGAVYQLDGRELAIAELPAAWARDAATPAAAPKASGIIIDCLACGALPERVTGSRYEALRSLTLRLHTMGHARAVQWEHVRDHLAPRFAEPLTEAEVRERFDRATADPDRMDRKAHDWQAGHPGGDERASSPGEPSGELPDLADAARLVTPPDVDAWYIVGLIRPGKLVYLAAGEGVGKSYVRKEAELRLAVGIGSLFGHYPIAGPVRVGTIDEENGPDEEWRREEELLPRLLLTRADLAGRYFRGSFLGLNLNAASAQAYIRRQVATFALDVLFLDTGGSMVDEEYGPPLKGAVRFLRSLIREFPALAIVVCVHMVKPPRGPNIAAPKRRALTDVMGQWTRQADVVAVMTDLGNDRIRWDLAKRRGVPKSAGILNYSDGLTRWMTDVDEAADPASTSDTIHVLRCIAAGAGTWEQVKEAAGMGRNRIFAAITELRAGGLIGPGSPYRMTSDGQEALQ